MAVAAHLLERLRTHFFVWCPRTGGDPPARVIGAIQLGNPPSLAGRQKLVLVATARCGDLFEFVAGRR